IVDFKIPFDAVGQRAVSSKDTGTACGQKLVMDSRCGVEDSRQPYRVVLPAPKLTFNTESNRQSVIDIGECPWLIFAIAPSGAKKRADIVHQFLLEIEAKAVFGSVFAGRLDVRGPYRTVERRLVAPHIGAIEIRENSHSAWMRSPLIASLKFND